MIFPQRWAQNARPYSESFERKHLFRSLPTLVLGSKSVRLCGSAAYCQSYPGRLKGMILVPGGNVEWAVKEVKRLRNETWVAAVWPLLPEGKPIDHPDLAPLGTR